MDLSRGHFYKTIEEAETAIKQYFKEHYFIYLNRPWRIKKNVLIGHRPPTNKNNCIRRELSPDAYKILFVGNRPWRIEKNLFVRIPDEQRRP